MISRTWNNHLGLLFHWQQVLAIRRNNKDVRLWLPQVDCTCMEGVEREGWCSLQLCWEDHIHARRHALWIQRQVYSFTIRGRSFFWLGTCSIFSFAPFFFRKENQTPYFLHDLFMYVPSQHLCLVYVNLNKIFFGKLVNFR